MKNRTIFLFIGPPGSGKGTLSQLCVQKLGWRQVSTGNLCRKHIEEGTQIGKEIDFAIKSGKLVSDNLITQMVVDWFSKNDIQGSAVILDGYPRTVAQAQAFDTFASDSRPPFSIKVVRFELEDDKIIERLARRYICLNSDCQEAYAVFPGSDLAPVKEGICDRCGHAIGRRKDDDLAIIKERLRGYREHEKKLLDFYHNAGYTVYEFFTDQPIEDLFDQFKKMMGGSVA